MKIGMSRFHQNIILKKFLPRDLATWVKYWSINSVGSLTKFLSCLSSSRMKSLKKSILSLNFSKKSHKLRNSLLKSMKPRSWTTS